MEFVEARVFIRTYFYFYLISSCIIAVDKL